MDNAAIAHIFQEMADAAEVRGDNVFRIRALRNAAAAIGFNPFPIESLRGDPAKLREIRGIGEGIAKKVLEILETGSCAEHREILREFPPSLLEVLNLEGVGPKKVKVFRDVLGVRSVADLEAAARAGKVRGLPRMSAGIEEKLLKSIEAYKARRGRFLLVDAETVVRRLIDLLRDVPGVRRIEPAGSYRRRRETVGDIDLLVVCDDPATVADRFCGAGETIGRGETKCSVRLPGGQQADLRIVPEESLGAALHYFTGSKAHNVAVRSLAVRRGLTVNEYGVFEVGPDGATGRRVGGEREEEVFAAVGLPPIPPELREDRGEIEAAAAGRLPRLVEVSDIRGDVHLHTTATDGTATVEEMARAAADRGLRYIAVTDHSKALAMTGGLDEAAVRAQALEIAAAQEALGDRIRIFRGIEVDVLKDGQLDLARDLLSELDVVVASVHSHFALGREEMTARVVRAIESGSIDIIGHPTGRVLLRREPYELDLERVLEAARAHGVALELNSYPDRLDLSDLHCRRAKDLGVKVAIDTDSHSPAHLGLLRFGIDAARRGWLEPGDIANCREADEFLDFLHEGHR